MGAETEISWAEATFNPWEGCTRLSPACDNCYAADRAHRFGNDHLWAGERRRTSASNWKQPLKWNRDAEARGVRIRVFCASLADVFDNQVHEEWRADLWKLIRATPNLLWMILTKRPQNIRKMLPSDWHDGYPNVWLGTTCENQDEADRRLPDLIRIPSAAHFLSCEPLLGLINFGPSRTYPLGLSYLVDWIICGGESGSKARPMHPDWARSLRDQCVAAGVPFHFKQWGEYLPNFTLPGRHAPAGEIRLDATGKLMAGMGLDQDAIRMDRVRKRVAGRLLDGREWNELPRANSLTSVANNCTANRGSRQ